MATQKLTSPTEMNPPRIVEASSPLSEHTGHVTQWTADEIILFEIAKTKFDPNSGTFFRDIADTLPGKTVAEVAKYYMDSKKCSKAKNLAPMAKDFGEPLVIHSHLENIKLPKKNSRPPRLGGITSDSGEEYIPKRKKAYGRRGKSSDCSYKGPPSLCAYEGQWMQNFLKEIEKSEKTEGDPDSDILIYEYLHPMQVRAEDVLLPPFPSKKTS